MSNTFGNSLRITLFGESHGPFIGITLDGLSAGTEIHEESIREALSKRRPSSLNETARVEKDDFRIISGVWNGRATGMPLTILIPNENIHSSDYEKTKDLPRPSHADFAAHEKYHGYEDYRGGGHFSGRITAALVAGGAIVLDALEKNGIRIGSHILSVGSVKDRKINDISDIDAVNSLSFPVLSDVRDAMEKEIEKARLDEDSVGGTIETAVYGLPAGLGSPVFDSMEGNLAKAVFAVGAVKGIEFGDGFGFASMKGSEANDAFRMENGRTVTLTNHNGGINGGITNGMPLTFNVVVKPTPSIAKKQETVNYATGENDEIEIRGRHDPAIIRRVNIVLRSVTALVIADALLSRYGEDALTKGF